MLSLMASDAKIEKIFMSASSMLTLSISGFSLNTTYERVLRVRSWL